MHGSYLLRRAYYRKDHNNLTELEDYGKSQTVMYAVSRKRILFFGNNPGFGKEGVNTHPCTHFIFVHTQYSVNIHPYLPFKTGFILFYHREGLVAFKGLFKTLPLR